MNDIKHSRNRSVKPKKIVLLDYLARRLLFSRIPFAKGENSELRKIQESTKKPVAT